MTTSRPDGRVVHTPPAKGREGLLGYVLRTSEANGYETPWYIFSLAGISQGGMTRSTLPIDKLARVVGRPIKELARLPWQRYPNGDPVPALNVRGAKLTRHLQLKHPKICPQCIAESGVIDAAWDLRIMLVCPIHRVAMVDRCPACHGKLTWFRPGLDRCRCGHHLTAQEQSSFPQHTIDLLQVVYNTLHGLPTNPTPPSGIPAYDLQSMGAPDLLRLLSKLDNTIAGMIPRGNHRPYELDRLACLSDMFANWPRQFHKFLRTIDPFPDEATCGLTRRFEGFYSNLVAAKTMAKENMLFFRKAFGQYGSYDGLTPGADPRFFLTPSNWQALREQGLSFSQIRVHNGEASSQTINQAELARHLGVRPITARRWAQHGLLGLKSRDTLAGGQTVYKTLNVLPRKITTGAMDIRDAAKYLGIPVSILERLRRDGYYRVEHTGSYLAQFTQPDLDTLRSKVLECATKMLPNVPEGHVTLSALFRMKLHGVENKYRIVRSILNGGLVSAGRLGENVGDLVIAGKLIETFRNDVNAHRAIPASRVAKTLECDTSVCCALVAEGKLRGAYRGRVLHVTTESIESFRRQFVSCIGIAKRLRWSIRRLLRVLSDHGVDLLRVQRTCPSHNAGQTFCPREQADKLFGISLFAVRPADTPID